MLDIGQLIQSSSSFPLWQWILWHTKRDLIFVLSIIHCVDDGDPTVNTLLNSPPSCAICKNREIGLGMQGVTTKRKGAEAVGPRKVRMFLLKPSPRERGMVTLVWLKLLTNFLIGDYPLQAEALLLFTDSYVRTQRIFGRTLISVLIVIVDDLRSPLYDLTL